MTDKLILKPGRDKSLKRRHPWVFSGAVGSVEGEPGLGDTVDVFSAQGERLGCAAYSPQSSIRARMWAFGEEDCRDMASFLTDRMRIAIYKRVHNDLFNTHNNGLRLIHAESDGLPGLVVDQYDNWLGCPIPDSRRGEMESGHRGCPGRDHRVGQHLRTLGRGRARAGRATGSHRIA